MNVRQAAMTWAMAAVAVAGGAVIHEALAAEPAQSVAAAPHQIGPPPPGRYDGQLCVSTASASMSCGPVTLQFQRGTVRVQVSDIVYRLKLRSSQTEVVLLHGAMQIDQFIADYGWAPRTLSFADLDKEVRYELRWETPQRR